MSEIGYCCKLMKTRTAAHSRVNPHTIDLSFFVFPSNKQIVKVLWNINSPNVAYREDSKVSRFLLNIMKLVEYRIAKKWVLESGIQLKESEIPFYDWNPESKFHSQSPESSTCNPEPTAWNPKSKTVLDSLTWDKKLTTWVFLSLCWIGYVIDKNLNNVTSVNKY